MNVLDIANKKLFGLLEWDYSIEIFTYEKLMQNEC